METVKSLPPKKTPGTDGLSAGLRQTFTEELTPVCYELVHETKQKEPFQTHSTRPVSLS